MKRHSFTTLILSALLVTGCKQTETNKNAWLSDPHGHIRFASSGDPQTLDPRYARNLLTVNVVENLFEALLRVGSDKTILPAAAESYVESEDGLTYTFKLRQAKWSNGDSVTSHHFADSWKSQLAPDSAAPNANQLYVIKNAHAVKDGKLPIEQVGIETPDNMTLIVHLETPLPYFKELVCSYFFLPVHPKSTTEALISNGPFMLDSWKKNNEIVGIKNPEYWDVNRVNLQKFSFVNLEDHTALQMYEADQIDWAGSPLSMLPPDAIVSLKRKRQLYTAPSAGTYWFRVNTTKSPLSNEKLRQALAYAIDRKALVKSVILGDDEMALSVVPPTLGLGHKDYFSDANVTKAWELFQEALVELNIPLDDLPKITILYSTGTERNQRIVQTIQQQWKKVFGDIFVLKGSELKSLVQNVGNLDYDIALGSWFADIEDPSNFLDIFTQKGNGGNNTGWENPEYAAIMQKSLLAKTAEERTQLLDNAQEILIQGMPVIPLFYGSFTYVKKRNISGVGLSSLGQLDLKNAYIDLGDADELEVLE